MTTPNLSPAPWTVAGGFSPKVVDADGKAVCMVTPRKGAWNGHAIAEAPALIEAARAMIADMQTPRTRKGMAAWQRMAAILARIDAKD